MTALPPEVLRRVVAAAGRAPSVHNTQPWRWRATPRGVVLHAHHAHRLMHADPQGRDLMISCGAALHTLVVAAAAEGFRARVRRMPDPRDPSTVADVSFRPEPATAQAVALAGAISRRRTDRRPPTSWPVPEERLLRLATLAGDLGVRATDVTSPADALPVPELVAQAERAQGLDRGYHDELLAWSSPRDAVGVPRDNVPERTAGSDGAGGTRFPAGHLPTASTDGPTGAAWVLLSTSSDDPLSWLRTGEALQACWLWTTLEGMSLVPYSQPLEVDRTRSLLQRDHLADTSCPQLLLRVGWPSLTAPAVPPTPRRAVSDVLEI